MREIKFRAWDKIGEVMVYQDRITIAENGNWILISRPGSDFEGRGIPLMQFTGLKDKNGKEIYEGDVLRYDEEERVVVYEAPSFELQLKDTRAFAWDNWAEFGEIIGNIYENPELLK